MTTLKLGDGFPKCNPELSTQVQQLQGMLKTWGYNISETGHFDWPTDGAVLHFQKSAHINPDAKVTVDIGKTWKALLGTLPTVLPGQSFLPDTTYPVPFIDQFDNVHVVGAGQTGCFAACEAMLRAVGVKQAGAAKLFQVITKETWKNGTPDQTIDTKAVADGMKYLNEKLDKGIPVMVGVSYTEGTHNEGITEHFVVIYEKVSDLEYRFHDPAAGNKSLGAARTFSMATATDNLSVAGIQQYAAYAIGKRYYVTQIRKNVE